MLNRIFLLNDFKFADNYMLKSQFQRINDSSFCDYSKNPNIHSKENQMSKKLLITASFVIFSVLQLIAQEQPYKHSLLSQPRGSFIKKNSATSKPGDNNPGEAEFTGQSGTGANIDVVYHRVNWTVDPRAATNLITGSVVTYFKTITTNVSAITLDLRATSFNNGSLSITHRGSVCAKSFTGNVLNITLNATLAATNTLDSIVIDYSGVPPVASGAAQGYQRSGTAPNQYTGSLSESYEDRDWWPCKADMQDKVDSMDINVTVPWNNNVAGDTFWVATNGRLYDSTITGLNRTFKFKTRYPIATYLVTLSVGKFTRYYRSIDINGTIVPVAYYILRNTTGHATKTAAMDKVNPVVDSLSRRWGDYPFKLEKHGFYDGLVGAGGMEHQTFSAMASGSMASLATLNHELAHQWFGDNVTFATWNDLWLAEGPARFSEAYAAEQVPALGYTASSVQTMKNTLKLNALGLNSQSAWIPNSSMGTSALIWSTNYGSTVYERGGMIITMLRTLCGDTKFSQAMTNYQTALAGKSATSDSLRNHFNRVLKADISGFFNAYVGGSGGTPAPAGGGLGNNVDTIYWSSPATNKLVLQVGVQTKTNAGNTNYFQGPVVVRATAPGKDTTIIFYDWGGGSLSFAGNGLSVPFTGNALNYELSFTPTALIYDDSARTLSTGGTRNISALKGYVWQGATSSAWNTTTNWMAGVVPPAGAQVTITTSGTSPVLPGNTTLGKLFLNTGTKLSIGANTLTINDAISGTGTITGSSASNIVINGALGTINMDQTSAATRSLNNLTIFLGASAKLGNAMDVYGTITLNSATFDLNAMNLTLKSNLAGTARIGDLTNCTLSGATNVTVERYISDVGRRAWRLLSVPVTGSQTIKQAWQENAVNAANLGTNITSNLYTVSNGFDASSGNSSILTHVQGGAGGPSWNGTLANTSSTLLSAFPAYMLFVRGDRFATSGNALHAPTVLRSTGTIRQGAQAAITVSATGTGYTLVGNPYPSPIDFETIAGTANLNQSYYLWDPTLTGNYGVGGYRLAQRTAPNTYQQTPVVLGGPVVDPTIRYIHSGQAFFLKATGANASVVLTEASKAATVSIVNPVVQGGVNDQQLIVNLMVPDAANTASLADGCRISYNDNNRPDISDDILKIGNFGENISSIRSGKSFIVENRPMISNDDTIFLRLTNLGTKKYRFQIGTIDLVQTNVKAVLQDNFRGTNIDLDLSSINDIDFEVTANAASSASNRFKIVFAISKPAPVSFTSVKAYQQNAAIAVEWQVTSQTNLLHYEIEKSTDAVAFSKAATQAVIGADGSDAAYSWLDMNPVTGNNFYRIRSVGLSSDIKISQVVKVIIGKENSSIVVYPNPVTKRLVAIHFNEMVIGDYQLRLISTTGQVVRTQSLKHNGGSVTQTLKLGSEIAHGVYLLEITNPDNIKTTKTLVIRE